MPPPPRVTGPEKTADGWQLTARAMSTIGMDDYQLWPHGYAAIATLRAARRALKVIATTPCTLDLLAKATKANAGHLHVSRHACTHSAHPACR